MAVSSVNPSSPLPLKPCTVATRYTPDGKGAYARQICHYVDDHYVSHTDRDGRLWQAFSLDDRGRVLRVLDGDGNVRLNCDFDHDLHARSLEQVVLAPEQDRLFVVTDKAVCAFDVALGTRVGELPNQGDEAVKHVLVTQDGRVLAASAHEIQELTPDLAPVHTSPVPGSGFSVSTMAELPGGDVVVAGACSNDRLVYPDCECHGAVLLLEKSGDLRVVDHAGAVWTSGVAGPDGAYWFPGYNRTSVHASSMLEKLAATFHSAHDNARSSVHRFDPVSGETRVMPCGSQLGEFVPRADGSFLAVQRRNDDGGPSVSLHDASGRSVGTFRFQHPWTDLEWLQLGKDGKSAWVLIEKDSWGRERGLFRLDLERGLQELPGHDHPGPARSQGQQPGDLICTTRWNQANVIAMPLFDGRMLLCEPDRATLLDDAGKTLQTFASWREAQDHLGDAFQPAATVPNPTGVEPTTAAWEAFIVRLDDPNYRYPHSQKLAWGPLETVTCDPTLSREGETTARIVQGGLGGLWRRNPSAQEVVAFPLDPEATMSVESKEILIRKGGRYVAGLSCPDYGDECYTDAAALDLGKEAFVLAGTSEGRVFFDSIDRLSKGGACKQVYLTGSPVTHVGLLDPRHATVETRNGTVLVLDLPLAPGDEAVAGGSKAIGGNSVGGESRDGSHRVQEGAQEVVINGIRIRKRAEGVHEE